jgi:hypothetical protein
MDGDKILEGLKQAERHAAVSEAVWAMNPLPVGAMPPRFLDVGAAAIAADNVWLRRAIMEHAAADGWPLSQRNALLEVLGC